MVKIQRIFQYYQQKLPIPTIGGPNLPIYVTGEDITEHTHDAIAALIGQGFHMLETVKLGMET